MHQRWLSKDTDLGHKRRTVTRNAALAFDAFDHRGFFAADVGTGTAAHLDVASLDNTSRLKFRDFSSQDMQHSRIFVAHVNIGTLCLHGPSRDQHAL